MPQENFRKRARKLVQLPSGDTIYVPVITEIDFIDPVGNPNSLSTKWAPGQEWDYTVDNTAQSGRTVHVDPVNPITVDSNGAPTDDPPNGDTGQNLYVERIDKWPVVNGVERGQEYDFQPDNKTGAGPTDDNGNPVLPHFSTHLKTHIYRYYQDPNNPDDGGVWIDSELIDQFDFIDGVNRSQESQFTLFNSTNADFQNGDLTGQADPSDPDITIGATDDNGNPMGEGTQDNPVRLDPFQNIVNFNVGSGILLGGFNLFPEDGTGVVEWPTSKNGGARSWDNNVQVAGSPNITGAAYGKGKWIAVAQSTADFWVSTDSGLTWTQKDGSKSGPAGSAIAFGNVKVDDTTTGIWVSIDDGGGGGDGGDQISYSIDGDTWTTVDAPWKDLANGLG